MTQNDSDGSTPLDQRIQTWLQRNASLPRWIGLPILWAMSLTFGLVLAVAFRIKCWLGGENDPRC